MPKLSVVINVVDEEVRYLEGALESVKGFADEIVVIDMGAGEKISEIAGKFGANVFPHKRLQYVEPARNFGASKATGDWVLVLDPDERVEKELAEHLKSLMADPKADYYRLPRKNIVFDKWIQHSRWWPDYNIRFFKKGFVSWDEVIHKVPLTKGDGADIPAEERLAIVHMNYPDIERFMEHLNRYSSIQSENLLSGGYKFSWHDLISKPAGEFLSRFFAGHGYKDGVHGLALSGLQAFSEFVVYLKVWQKQGFREERVASSEFTKLIHDVGSELNYWRADRDYNEGGGIVSLLKRKFKLS